MLPNGAPRPNRARRGIYRVMVRAQPPIGVGANRTVADNRFRTCRKGAAHVAGCPEGRGPPPETGEGVGYAHAQPPSASERSVFPETIQSSSQDTEALSAAGAVRRRRARTPRAPTVWTVESRMVSGKTE